MLKNKKFEVKMVKDEDSEPIKTQFPTEPFITAEEAVGGILVVIGTYMLADTLRKCIIHTVATKVT